ncbi:MAG: hypothetical protein E7680_04315 [Ruminococcaceae bacterium]|nr:hypothetical protein [Oscillospiraceae bacterium]
MQETAMPKKPKKTLINISKKTFIQVLCLLFAMLVVSAILTYVIPRGSFGTTVGEDGKETVDYSVYNEQKDLPGVSPVKAIFAPVLAFASGDGIALLMLSLFLFVISAAFQVMNDVGGVRSLVGGVSAKFKNRRKLLLVLVAFLFYCFGSFLGLFEEMLTMLPIVAVLCLSLGYDSFTGFLTCILACGFGFAGAVTNPFTVLYASQIIGVNPMEKIWFRLIVFAVMFLLFLVFLFIYLRRIEKNPEKSYTFEHDKNLREQMSGEAAEATDPAREKRARVVYAIFLLAALGLIILCSSLSALRDYTVPVLIAYFLIFGIGAGLLVAKCPKKVFASFGKGFLAALPTIVIIAFAASVKYVFAEGSVFPTIVHWINTLAAGKSLIAVALIIYLIVLLLEFFISSSTAKAVLVMGLLAVANVGLSKEMLVLLYTFADGYTNVLFPTSPVLLLSLSMIEMDYFKWIKKSWWLFLLNFALVIGFILLAVGIGY